MKTKASGAGTAGQGNSSAGLNWATAALAKVATGAALAAVAAVVLGSEARAQLSAPAVQPTPFLLERGAVANAPLGPRAQAVVDDFERAYNKAGKPRVAMLWNRELTDRYANDRREVSRLGAQVSADGNRLSISASQGSEVVAQAQRQTSLSERDLWQLETEFTRRLLDAGVAVIDRATTMRLVARAPGGGGPDAQPVEMSALVGYADLFLEVLLTRDPAAPLGWGFRSNLKEIKSGRVLGSQYLSAMPELPPAAKPTWQVRPGGYEQVAGPVARVTVQDIGDTLALDTMQELARRLARR